MIEPVRDGCALPNGDIPVHGQDRDQTTSWPRMDGVRASGPSRGPRSRPPRRCPEDARRASAEDLSWPARRGRAGLLALLAGACCIAGLLAGGPASAAPADAAAPSSGAASGAYKTEVETWRSDRESRLKAEGGWLSVAGLFWLKEGENRFGTDPACEIPLPSGSTKPVAGVIILRGQTTSVRVNPGVLVTREGKPVEAMDLKADTEGPPDVLALGALKMHVIKRGERFGIRLKDPNSPMRKAFKGLHWFPVDPSYRLSARFVPYDPPKEIAIPTVLGTTEKMKSPGYVTFTWKGQEVRLDPVEEDPESGELSFIFRDGTSGKETYPPGRFLDTDPPKNGTVVMDFNKAYNPPCAFTPHATCPLPPPQNRLAVRIEAGERYEGHH